MEWSQEPANPTGQWTVRQACNLLQEVGQRIRSANCHAERFVRSVRAECTDRLLLHGEQHTATVLAEYAEHFNTHRPHQGLGPLPAQPRRSSPSTPNTSTPTGRTRGLDHYPPNHDAAAVVPLDGTIRRRKILSGLIDEYRRPA